MTQPDPTQPVPLRRGRHAARRPRALQIAMVVAVVMLVITAAVFAYLWGASRPRTGVAGSPPATGGTFSAGGTVASAGPTTTTRPPVRRLGILIMQNIGLGESIAQQNRVFFVGRDTKPGPGLHIVPAAIQPVDVDPDPDVRRIANMPLAQILQRAKRGERLHPSPQLVARPGERVQLLLQNRDRVVHSFTFDEADPNYRDAPRGRTTVFEFTVPRLKKPTAYSYYCRWRSLGMDGLFVVQGSPVPKLTPRGP